MLKGYKGRILSSVTPTTNSSYASGIWQREEQMQNSYISSWPLGSSTLQSLYNSALVWFPGSSSTWYLNGSATTQSPGSAYTSFGADEVQTSVNVLKGTSGQSAYYRLGSASATIGTTHSISVWYRSGDGSSASQMLWGNDVYYTGNVLGLNMYDAGNTGVALNNADSSSNLFSGAGSYPLNSTSWRLYTVTFNGTTANLYVNGSLVGAAPTYRGYDTNNSNQFVIGNTIYSGGYLWGGATGRFSNFAVWNNKVLSSAELTTLYNSGSPANSGL